MPKKDKSKCWEILFKRHKILQQVKKNWFFEITAEQIKKEYEPRLMAKFDHYDQLPDIFKNNHLSILPNKNGSYLIWPFSTHQDLNYWNIPVRKVKDRKDLESINPNNLFSEAVSLNYALATWMIKDLVGEVCELTLSWRMKSSNFKFKIKGFDSRSELEINVDNAQIEIDWWYESKHKLVLIEAKKWKCDDFIIRQLYYPYRLWKNKITKEVIPVFMTESNWIFSFFIFKFENENKYNSLKLVKQLNYSIDFETISEEEKKALKNIKCVKEPKVPFPQADDFEKCINVLELLNGWEKTKEEISDTFWYVKRQWDYYTNANKYLWLVEEAKKWSVKLTPLWKEIITLPRKNRNLRLIKLILSHKVFKDIYKVYSKSWKISTDDAVKIMKKCKLYKIDSDVTYKRRASTIKLWCWWIDSIINEQKDNTN